jgi:hypothetical protein
METKTRKALELESAVRQGAEFYPRCVVELCVGLSASKIKVYPLMPTAIGKAVKTKQERLHQRGSHSRRRAKPNVRFVPVKTGERLELEAVHRM